jgi:chaperonin GroES
MALKPLGDRVVVKQVDPQDRTKGGIILPDAAKEKPQEGKVVAIGPGRLLDDGTVKSVEVKSGDRILYGKYAGTEVSVEDTEYVILREEDILAVVQ